MPVLLWQDNLASGSTNYNIAQGSYGDFLLRISGTAVAGQTVALSDLGNVRLNVNGDDKVNVDFGFLNLVANEYGGFIENDSAAGGAFNFSFIVPCHAWQDSLNVYHFGPNDKAYFNAVYASTLAAKVSVGTITIEATPKQGIQTYYHKLLNQNVNASGAGQISNTINQPNIIELYLKDPAALTTTMQFSKDGIEKVNSLTTAEVSYSNWIHLLESAVTFYAYEFAPSGNLNEANSQQLSYKYLFSGAGLLEQYYSAIEWSTAKQIESTQTLQR